MVLGGLTLRWLLRRLLERAASVGASTGGWAARARATHCWIRVVMSGVLGTMADVGTMMGSEAMSETVGRVTAFWCSWSTNRESCSSLVWAAARREASLAKNASKEV